ncbi:hypothetical protein LZC95_50865 [Pendulispora brunnea]|uniref:Uncharacterized protein n=1 Tax=Pendulispora brunnea TaxID=2905690 RepID=A0ABZ2K7Q9_9BACT
MPSVRLGHWGQPAMAILAIAFHSRIATADAPRAESIRGVQKNPSERPVLVLMAPESARGSLEERAAGLAAAHIRAGGATLQLARIPELSLEARRAEAHALLGRWSARGVMWIQPEAADKLVVYLLVPEVPERTFRREIAAPNGQTAAALETVANVAASSAMDVLEGRAVAMEPVEAAAADAVPVAAQSEEVIAPAPFAAPREVRAPDRVAAPFRVSESERFTLSAGYAGGTFGRSVPWQHAISLSAAWAPIPQLRFGVGYDIMPIQTLREQPSLELSRHPAFGTVGYRIDFAGGLGSFDVGARITFDTVTRTADAPNGPMFAPGLPGPPGPVSRFERSTSATNLLVSVAPIAGLRFRLTEQVAMALWGGLDVPLNRLPQGGPPFMAVETDAVRFLGGVGFQLALPGSGTPAAVAAGPRRTKME